LDFDICGFFGQGEFFNLHSTDWHLVLGLTTPRFITSDDTIQKNIFLKSFHKVHVQNEMSFLLLLHQVLQHKLMLYKIFLSLFAHIKLICYHLAS
jgi:hypothetical protein